MKNSEYDVVQYGSRPFDYTAPDHLASVGILHGLNPTPVQNCRVLELGCASGGNLIPLGVSFPQSEYLGVDSSAVQIDEGRKLIGRLGQANVKLLNCSIEDLPSDIGTFDYIIAHGLYSWIPEKLQPTVFDILRECLSPSGIAYISFNTYPGWHFAEPVRDALMYRTRNMDIASKPGEARRYLELLASTLDPQSGPYGQMIAEEKGMLSRQPDYYLLYDHMNKFNNACYVSEFLSLAQERGIQYIADAELPYESLDSLPEEMRNLILGSGSVVDHQQYLDFAINRRFRHALLCREHLNVEQPSVSNLDRLYFYCHFSPMGSLTSETMADGYVVSFINSKNVQMSTGNRLAKLLLVEVFGSSSDRYFTLGEIMEGLRPFGFDGANETLSEFLKSTILNLIINRFISTSSAPTPYQVEEVRCPEVSPLVYDQLYRQEALTNLRHQITKLDDVDRYIISKFTGEFSLEEIAAGIKAESIKERDVSAEVFQLRERSTDSLVQHLRSRLSDFRANALML